MEETTFSQGESEESIGSITPPPHNPEMQAAPDIQMLNEKIKVASQFVTQLYLEIGKTVIGQSDMMEKLLIGLLANGHVLLEGVPGLAKTLAISSLSKAIDVDFSRIQFTPDLLPADLIGTMIYNQKEEKFRVRKGPVFSNFVLADEINRAPAKVQAALLEAMQEKQVTIGDKSYELPKPFLVLATQNPVEQEGTYPLPEAQVDRFMLKVVIGYPSKEEEKLIIRNNISATPLPEIQKVVSAKQILEARQIVREIYMDAKIEQYIVDIVFATRNPEDYGMGHLKELINFGASPRASISMAIASKAYAFIHHRGYVIPEDVRAVTMDILRHRIGITYEAEAENITQEQIVTEIVNKIDVP